MNGIYFSCIFISYDLCVKKSTHTQALTCLTFSFFM